MDSSLNHRVDDTRIDAYLSDVEGAMPKVPTYQREGLSTELRMHLESLVEAYMEVGESPETAMSEALLMMGEPKSLGRQYGRTWFLTTDPGRVFVAWGAMALTNAVIRSCVALLIGAGAMADSSIVPLLATVVGPFAVAGFVGGWFVPKGAVKAGIAQIALSMILLAEDFLMPHGVFAVLAPRQGAVIIGALCCFTVAFFTSLFRTRHSRMVKRTGD